MALCSELFPQLSVSCVHLTQPCTPSCQVYIVLKLLGVETALPELGVLTVLVALFVLVLVLKHVHATRQSELVTCPEGHHSQAALKPFVTIGYGRSRQRELQNPYTAPIMLQL